MPMKHAGHTRSIVAVLATLVAALVAACGEGNGATACLPEDVQACTCDDGRAGFRVCDPEAGTGYGSCDCSGNRPYLPEAGVDDAGEGGEAAACSAPPLAFMCPCNVDGDCATGLCGAFPAKGPHCTQRCTNPSDCPPPSPGCNNQGMCKTP
jgi:hypothetical protein